MSEFLILGATGKTGRRVVNGLTAGGHAVRAGSRTPSPDDRPGVTPVRFDWADPSTYDDALRGVDGVYVVPPELRLDWAPDAAALLDRAAALDVRSAVLLTARGAELNPAGAMAQAEAALAASPLLGTVVRPTWFLQNLDEGFLRPGVDAGQLVAPAGDGAEPFIDADDIAAVVVAALTDPERHAAAAYDLSGPRALTFAEIAEALTEALGREVTYVDPGEAAWIEGSVEAGMPRDYTELLAFLFSLIRDHHDAHLSDGVQRALGREPGSFEAWLDREAGALGGLVATRAR